MSTTAMVKSKFDQLNGQLEAMKPELARALPRNMTADRVLRIILTECRKNPMLLECDRTSFLASVMTACQMGLEVGSHMGEAYLIPFGKTVTLVAGYKGLVKLCYQSEMVASVDAEVVFEKDVFEHEKGDNSRLKHLPYQGKDRGPAVAYYAIIRLKDGGIRRAVMQKWEVELHRDRFSKAARRSDSVWTSDFDAMALKTVLRKAAKLAPQSVERPSLAEAIALDEMAEAGVKQDLTTRLIEDVPSLAPAGALDRMADEAEGEAK